MIGMVGGIFAEELFWPYFVERPLFYKHNLERRPVEVTRKEEITISENKALQDSIEEVESSVVSIESAQDEFLGSGLIASSDGMIVTLKSVTDGTSTVVYQGQELEAGLVKVEGEFTVLKMEQDNLPTRNFVAQPQLGQRVFLMGKMNDLTVVNHGIVKYLKEDEIHTNIFESKTLQGSPLLDIEGNVLGLVTVDQQGKVVGVPLPQAEELFGPEE